MNPKIYIIGKLNYQYYFHYENEENVFLLKWPFESSKIIFVDNKKTFLHNIIPNFCYYNEEFDNIENLIENAKNDFLKPYIKTKLYDLLLFAPIEIYGGPN